MTTITIEQLITKLDNAAENESKIRLEIEETEKKLKQQNEEHKRILSEIVNYQAAYIRVLRSQHVQQPPAVVPTVSTAPAVACAAPPPTAVPARADNIS